MQSPQAPCGVLASRSRTRFPTRTSTSKDMVVILCFEWKDASSFWRNHLHQCAGRHVHCQELPLLNFCLASPCCRVIILPIALLFHLLRSLSALVSWERGQLESAHRRSPREKDDTGFVANLRLPPKGHLALHCVVYLCLPHLSQHIQECKEERRGSLQAFWVRPNSRVGPRVRRRTEIFSGINRNNTVIQRFWVRPQTVIQLF